jgi:hypothetical protein
LALSAVFLRFLAISSQPIIPVFSYATVAVTWESMVTPARGSCTIA